MTKAIISAAVASAAAILLLGTLHSKQMPEMIDSQGRLTAGEVGFDSSDRFKAPLMDGEPAVTSTTQGGADLRGRRRVQVPPCICGCRRQILEQWQRRIAGCEPAAQCPWPSP